MTNPRLSLVLTETVKFHLQMLRPLKFSTLNTLKRLDITVEKEFWQLLLAVGALFEFSLGYCCSFPEVSVPVEYLVDFVFDFGLEVKFF